MFLTPVCENTISVYQYLDFNKENTNRLFYEGIINSLFYKIYLLHCFGIQHNDCHLNNFLVCNNPGDYNFPIGENHNVIELPYKMLLYDFDRAYFVEFGNNVINDEEICFQGGYCNQNNAHDQFIILSHLINLCVTIYGDSLQSNIINDHLEYLFTGGDVNLKNTYNEIVTVIINNINNIKSKQKHMYAYCPIDFAHKHFIHNCSNPDPVLEEFLDINKMITRMNKYWNKTVDVEMMMGGSKYKKKYKYKYSRKLYKKNINNKNINKKTNRKYKYSKKLYKKKVNKKY